MDRVDAGGPGIERPPGQVGALLWRFRWGALTLIALLVWAPLIVLAHHNATQFYLSQAAAQGETTMRLAVAVLRGQLERYEKLPELFAGQELIHDIAEDPGNAARLAEANRYLRQVNALLGSSDIYVILADGTTIAASNFSDPVTFIGENFSYRPYFTDAIRGGEGRFYALGTTSAKRGYYFGAPIRDGGAILGVVALKVDIDGIEEAWRAAGQAIMVTDPEGIIFMSAREDWRFLSLEPLTDERLARTAQTRRYADARLRLLPARVTGRHEGHELVTVSEGRGAQREYLALTEPMPEADWTVRVLLDAAPARAQARTATMLAAMALALATLAAAVYLQRRAQLRERMLLQREAQETLERRVEERTRELAELNVQLASEVTERRATESELRRTQASLVQAGKLAALGQMSAALSHELSQPLGAVRNYADNAYMLIDRERIPEARENVARIQGLVDRMSAISRSLRNFARKPNRQLSRVRLADVVEESVELIGWRLRAAGAELDIDLGPESLAVWAGPVRLQQVLVNILTNALDAIEPQAEKRIRLRAEVEGDFVTLTICDNGPGVPAGQKERIFDPFYTSKGVGKGLGLGLSISYNIVKDFGGDLRVASGPGEGACFAVTLRRADGAQA